MHQLLAISRNTYLQTVRQPLYGIIVLVTLGGLGLAPSLTGWTLDDDNKMLRDIGLSTLLIQGLFLACLCAAGVLDAEIDDKTVLTVIAKPVSRAGLILGKYVGLLAALTAAHYLAGIAFYMAMRHGVLQMASETSDVTVLVFGPGVAVVVLLVAGLLNYLYDRRFLPTFLLLAIPVFTCSMVILLTIDRDWKIQKYEVSQTMDDLPPEVADSSVLKGIVAFRPLAGEQQLTGHRGHLVRKAWRGPISEADQEYLLGLSESTQWKKDVNYLVQEARKLQGVEIFKAGILVLLGLALIAGVAIAGSTRFGTLPTFLICLVVLAAGLSSDQVIKPYAEAGERWADLLYRIIPNFQHFWMVDALSENRVIPWSFVGAAAGYGALYTAAALFLGMALFETREVG